MYAEISNKVGKDVEGRRQVLKLKSAELLLTSSRVLSFRIDFQDTCVMCLFTQHTHLNGLTFYLECSGEGVGDKLSSVGSHLLHLPAVM